MTPAYQDALGKWQATLRETLTNYVNGDYLRIRVKWTFPLSWGVSMFHTRKVLENIALATYTLNRYVEEPRVAAFLEHANSAIQRCHLSPEHCLLSVLTEGYELLDLLSSSQQHNLRSRSVCGDSGFDEDQYGATDSRYFAPVIRLARFMRHHMSPYLTMAAFHGSVADLGYSKGYSDLDTLLILNKSTVTEPRQLRRFAQLCYHSLMELYRFDPLQHHGHIVVTAIDLKLYPERWLPLAVLSDCRVVYQSNEDTAVFVRDCQREARKDFEQMVEYLQFRHNSRWSPHNAYDFKYFLSILMLLPTRYQQAKGVFCAKRDSFSLAKQCLPDAQWAIMDYATRCRLKWPYAHSTLVDVLGRVPHLLNAQLTRAIQDTTLKNEYRQVLSLYSPDVTKQAAKLAKQMYDSLYGDEPTSLSIGGDTLPLLTINHPVIRHRHDYDEARARYVHRAKNVSGVVAVHEYGSVGEPGLSDLDFVVSISDTVDNIIDAKTLSIDTIPLQDKSLILHEPLIVPVSQMQFADEFVADTNLQELWRSGSCPIMERGLAPKTARFAKTAQLIEKLLSYQIWFANALSIQVLDTRWAIAILKSIVYSVSSTENVTGCPPKGKSTYLEAVQRLRACWFEDPSFYRKNTALKQLFLLGEKLIENLTKIVDRFLITSGWLVIEDVSLGLNQVFPIPRSQVCVTFELESDQTGYPITRMPDKCASLVILPYTFLRVLTLYAQAVDLSKVLIIKPTGAVAYSHMTPKTEFENYLCARARKLGNQTRFLMRHRFSFGSYLSEYWIDLPCYGR